jgi:acetyl-CoA carboxylase biotin carboxyl carrier protein
MPDAQHPGDRSTAQRQADHASLARLSDTLVPALVAKLTGSNLGELEVREGDWRVRLRRPPGGMAAAPARRGERPRLGTHGHPEPRATGGAALRPGATTLETSPEPTTAIATSPTVGIFRPGAAIGTRVRAGDRIATVDLLGIPQDVASPIDGTLVELFVQAGEAVEYGEEIGAVEAARTTPQADPDGDATDVAATDGTATDGDVTDGAAADGLTPPGGS